MQAVRASLREWHSQTASRPKSRGSSAVRIAGQISCGTERRPERFLSAQQKRRKGHDIPEVADGLLPDLRRSAQKRRKRMEKHIPQQDDRAAQTGGAEQRRMKGLQGPALFPAGKLPGDQNARAGGHRHGKGDQDLHKGHGYGGGSHCAAAQAVSDENAVHDHIDGVEQQPDHLGNGIFCKKSVRLAFIHGDAPPQNKKRGLCCATQAYYTRSDPGGSVVLSFSKREDYSLSVLKSQGISGKMP